MECTMYLLNIHHLKFFHHKIWKLDEEQPFLCITPTGSMPLMINSSQVHRC